MTEYKEPIINIGQKMGRAKKPHHPGAPDLTPVPTRQEIEAIPFADLFSACDPKFSAINRLDPFWGGIWASGSSEASWTSRSLAERQSVAGLGRLPLNASMSHEQAIENLRDGYRWNNKLKMMGALDMWRTLSGEQMASIIGDASVLNIKSKAVASMFCSELIDVGVFHNMLVQGNLSTRANLYRPSRSDTFHKEIEPLLTYPEWVSVTGGAPFQSGGQYDRHNLLATELGLRIAEFCDVGSVIGEKHTTVDQLAGTGLGLTVTDADRRRADLAVLRPDGMRIAIELTASTSKNFESKARRWAQLLSERPFNVSGLTILFVLAPAPERENARGFYQRNLVYKVIAKAAKEFPGTAGDRTAARMGVIAWRDWFPAKDAASADFLTMRADFPTGPNHDLWQKADLLGDSGIDLNPRDPDFLAAAVSQSHLLLGVPHWLRDTSKSPQVWPTLLTRVGMDSIPYSSSKRPERLGYRSTDEFQKTFAPKPPKRLLIA